MAQFTQITTTNDIRAIFPDLPRTDKFKRTIDVFLRIVKKPLYIAKADDWRSFEINGKMYKTKISNGKQSIYLQRTKLISSSVTEKQMQANPNQYKGVKDKPSGRIKMGSNDCQKIFSCKIESTDPISWAGIANALGKLLKEEVEGLGDVLYVSQCRKCDGVGKLPHYAHIAEGLCFQCMGIGKWLSIDKYKMNQLA